MSLNSLNRFSNISAEVCENKVLEEKSEQLRLEEEVYMEEACAYIENVEISESFSNLLETSVQITENNINVFNSIIEDDFITAINEHMDYLNEETAANNNDSKKSELKRNVAKLVKGATSAVSNAGKKASTKAETMMKSDKEIYNKYSDALKKNNSLDGFEGIHNFAFPSDGAAVNINKVANISDIEKLSKKFTVAIKNARSKKDIDNAIDDFNLAIKSSIDDYQEAIKAAMKKEALWKPTPKDVTLMLTFINSDAIIKNFNKSTKQVVDALKAIEKDTEEVAKATTESSADELEVYKCNALYRCASVITRVAIQKFNAYRDLEVREIAAMRKAVIICGKYAIKNSEGIKESAAEQLFSEELIFEASDLYVYDLFMD